MSDSEDNFEIIDKIIGKRVFSRISKAFDKTNNRHLTLKNTIMGTSPAQTSNMRKCARRKADTLQ